MSNLVLAQGSSPHDVGYRLLEEGRVALGARNQAGFILTLKIVPHEHGLHMLGTQKASKLSPSG